MTKRKRRPSGESHLDILELLAKEGPLNKYEIEKKLKAKAPADHKTIYNAMNDLKDLEHVTITKTETSRVDRPIEFYDLAFLGLVALFQSERAIDIPRIATKYRDFLPLVFGKWDHFVKLGVEEVAEDLLKESFKNPVVPPAQDIDEVKDALEGATAYTKASEVDILRFLKGLKKESEYERVHKFRKRFSSFLVRSVNQYFYFGVETTWTFSQKYPNVDWYKVVSADQEMLEQSLLNLDFKIRVALDRYQSYNEEKQFLLSKTRP